MHLVDPQLDRAVKRGVGPYARRIAPATTVPGRTPIPDHVRRRLRTAAWACFGFVVALGAVLHGVRGPVGFDTQTARPVFGHLFGVPVVPLGAARAFQWLGNPVPFIAAVLALAAFGRWAHDRVTVRVAVAGPLLTVLAAELVAKPLFARTAVGGSNSFPSTHVAGMTALVVAAAVAAYRRWGRRGLTRVVPVAACLAGSMTIVVVRTSSHFTSDALAGVPFGAGMVLAVTAAVASR